MLKAPFLRFHATPPNHPFLLCDQWPVDWTPLKVHLTCPSFPPRISFSVFIFIPRYFSYSCLYVLSSTLVFWCSSLFFFNLLVQVFVKLGNLRALASDGCIKSGVIPSKLFFATISWIFPVKKKKYSVTSEQNETQKQKVQVWITYLVLQARLWCTMGPNKDVFPFATFSVKKCDRLLQTRSLGPLF